MILCLVDTNILLRSLDRKHPHCRLVRKALIVLRRGNFVLCLVPQNLIEFWGVATRPAANNGFGMDHAWTASQPVRMKRFFTLLQDTPDIFPEWERLVLQYRVSGKNVHDARLVAAMSVHGVSRILTFNGSDFARYPGISIVDPNSKDLTM